MKFVERDRRSATTRRLDESRRGEPPRLMTAGERRRIWERGFGAAMELVAQLSDPAPHIAKGTREDLQDLPTAPYPIVDLDLIETD